MTTEAPERPDLFDRTRVLVAVGGLVALALLPLLFLGPGTDLDAGAVIRSGRALVDGHTYRPSRPPGAPVHEAVVGVLEKVGGTAASNLGSLVAAAACAVLVVALLRRSGVGRAGLVAAVVVANPIFLVAATSTVDFLWALALLLAAALLLRGGRPIPAGLCAALAIGCRASTAVLVVALVVAEALEEDGRVRAAACSAVVMFGGLALFVPSFRASGDSLAFAQNDVPTSSFLVQVGRFAVKDLSFFGPFAAIVLVLCVPATMRVLGRWRADWLVRFSSLGLLASQLLFLRYPWKLGHLLPSLVCLALLLGVALRDKPGLLVALVAAQLLYCAVNLQTIRPNEPNAATSGRFTFTPSWGALVTDTRCRADDTSAWEPVTPERADAVWNCAKPWAR